MKITENGAELMDAKEAKERELIERFYDSFVKSFGDDEHDGKITMWNKDCMIDFAHEVFQVHKYTALEMDAAYDKGVSDGLMKSICGVFRECDGILVGSFSSFPKAMKYIGGSKGFKIKLIEVS